MKPAGRTLALHRRGGDAGFTLAEIVVAMGLMMGVLLVGMRGASVALDVETQAVGKAYATTEVAAAVSELRQEIVSANIIFDPQDDTYTSSSQSGNFNGYPAGTNYAGMNPAPDATNIPPGWSLRIYTQLNGNPMCVQWRVLDNGDLQTRTWAPGYQPPSGGEPAVGVVHPWSTLATNVVNGAGTVPFALNGDPDYGSRLVTVTFVVSSGDTRVADDTYETSVAARDAEYYPADTGDCYPVPTP